jgi:hypothetical protein
MTEQEWRSCEDPVKLVSLVHREVSERRLLLLACDCYRRFLPTDKRGLRAAAVLEGYAEGTVPGEEVARLRAQTLRRRKSTGRVLFENGIGITTGFWGDTFGRYHAAWQTALELIRTATYRKPGRPSRETARAWTATRAYLSAAVRDVHGPFPPRPISLDPTLLGWNDRTIPRVAQAIYEEKAFDRLPVLADALEEAGCGDPEILGHLRGPGPHVRGCFVLDLILSKDP